MLQGRKLPTTHQQIIICAAKANIIKMEPVVTSRCDWDSNPQRPIGLHAGQEVQLAAVSWLTFKLQSGRKLML